MVLGAPHEKCQRRGCSVAAALEACQTRISLLYLLFVHSIICISMMLLGYTGMTNRHWCLHGAHVLVWRHWMNEISVNGTSVQKNKHLIERSMMGAQRLCGCWSEEVTSQQNQPRWTAGSPISRVHTHVQWTQLKLSHRLNSIIQPLFFFLMWIWDVW